MGIGANRGIPAIRTLAKDLQAEMQLRFDRTSIAYRKRLWELGLTFWTT